MFWGEVLHRDTLRKIYFTEYPAETPKKDPENPNFDSENAEEGDFSYLLAGGV